MRGFDGRLGGEGECHIFPEQDRMGSLTCLSPMSAFVYNGTGIAVYLPHGA